MLDADVMVCATMGCQILNIILSTWWLGCKFIGFAALLVVSVGPPAVVFAKILDKLTEKLEAK